MRHYIVTVLSLHQLFLSRFLLVLHWWVPFLPLLAAFPLLIFFLFPLCSSFFFYKPFSQGWSVKRPLHVQAICTNCLHKLLDDCCRRYKHEHVAQPFRLLKLRTTVWILFNSFQEHTLIELIYSFITYFFSTFRYFFLYLFSNCNLAFCSFFLFMLL